MQFNTNQRRLFQTPISVGFEIGIAKSGKGDRILIGNLFRRLAIELQKSDNIHSGRQMQITLFEPH